MSEVERAPSIREIRKEFADIQARYPVGSRWKTSRGSIVEVVAVTTGFYCDYFIVTTSATDGFPMNYATPIEEFAKK